MRKTLGAGALAVLLSACGSYDRIVPPPGVVISPSIGVRVSGAANIIRGSTAQVTVTVARMAYYTGSIDLSVEALPTGVTAAFLPTTVPASSTTSTLTLSATTTAALGTATATVRARGVGVTDATIQIVMNVSQ